MRDSPARVLRGHTVRAAETLGEVAAVRAGPDVRFEAAAELRRNPGGAGMVAPP